MATALTHFTYLPFTQLFPTLQKKGKRKNTLKEWVHGCFTKINGERRYTYIALVEGEGVNLILWKTYSDKMFSVNRRHQHIRVLICSILQILKDVFFNMQSIILLVPTVLLFLSTYSFIPMQISSRGLATKNQNNLSRFFILTFRFPFVKWFQAWWLRSSQRSHFNLTYRIPQIQLNLLHTFIYTYNLTENQLKTNIRTRRYINFPIVNFTFIYSNI